MTKQSPHKIPPVTRLPRPDNAPRRKIFVRDLVLDAFIGVYDEEQGVSQKVVINIDVDVIEPGDPLGDNLEDVMCYHRLTEGVKTILASGHIQLVETLAERVADLALSNPLSLGVRVRVEKPEALSEAQTVGVELYRQKNAAD